MKTQVALGTLSLGVVLVIVAIFGSLQPAHADDSGNIPVFTAKVDWDTPNNGSHLTSMHLTSTFSKTVRITRSHTDLFGSAEYTRTVTKDPMSLNVTTPVGSDRGTMVYVNNMDDDRRWLFPYSFFTNIWNEKRCDPGPSVTWKLMNNGFSLITVEPRNDTRLFVSFNYGETWEMIGPGYPQWWIRTERQGSMYVNSAPIVYPNPRDQWDVCQYLHWNADYFYRSPTSVGSFFFVPLVQRN